ncbi:MAG TPA: AAA family ATPase [Vicinamibacterales bacterium]
MSSPVPHEQPTTTVPEGSEGYEGYFGLAEAPFALTSSPRFLFESASYLAALKEVDYALSRREQIIVVTGPIGTGKTTLCRMMAERRGPRTVVATISRPPETVDDLFRQVLDAFDLLTEDTKSIVAASHYGLQKVLRQFLDSLVALDAQAILVFDEAQHLRPAVLEEIRLLSNLDADRQRLEVVLVGQPELEDLLARTDLGQLDQRVSRRHRLAALEPIEVRSYVDRRLSAARGESQKGELPHFTNSAMQAIATFSRGVPRVINVLCDRALENAWSEKTHTVDKSAVVRAARALNIDVPVSIGERLKRFYAPAAVAAAVGAAALLVWTIGSAAVARRNRPTAPPPARTAQESPRPVPMDSRPSTPPAAVAARDAAVEAGHVTAPVKPAPPAVAAPAASTSAADNQLLVVVSSFHTRDRAAQVATEIVGLGLPGFVRTNSGWQEVVVGPYLSRDAALTAQQKLAGARYADTKIIESAKLTP